MGLTQGQEPRKWKPHYCVCTRVFACVCMTVCVHEHMSVCVCTCVCTHVCDIHLLHTVGEALPGPTVARDTDSFSRVSHQIARGSLRTSSCWVRPWKEKPSTGSLSGRWCPAGSSMATAGLSKPQARGEVSTHPEYLVCPGPVMGTQMSEAWPCPGGSWGLGCTSLSVF